MATTGVPNYKIILCGEYGVGKSALFRRFLDNSYIHKTMLSDGRKSTIGLDHSARGFDIGGLNVKLTLWDTGGMERMSFIGSSYYRGAQAALLCYSMVKRETFNFLSQYVLDIVMNAEGAKIFLCGNMADVTDPDKVTDQEVESFVHECGNVFSGVYQISCRDNKGVYEMFRDIAKVMHNDFETRMTLKRGIVLRASDIPDESFKKNSKCC